MEIVSQPNFELELHACMHADQQQKSFEPNQAANEMSLRIQKYTENSYI